MVAAALLLPGSAAAAGPGGWSHLGDTPLNGRVSALNTDRPGLLYVGGGFIAAGGVSGADRIASWDATNGWQAVSSPGSQISNGLVNAIAYDAATGDVFAGGTFTNAGGNPNADFLAVWNGVAWAPFCNGAGGPPITATVNALQIIGRELYIGGSFADGAGITSADRLVACDIDTGAASSTVIDPAHEFTGTIYAMTSDSNGRLYAGGGFTDLGGNPAADNIAYLDGGGWHSMGSGGGPCGCAVDDYVRSLAAVGTDVYVGTDAKDVAGIAQADTVVRWNGSAWSALGANTGGTDGWFPASGSVYGLAATTNPLAGTGQTVVATGSFQNAGGDPTADGVALFDGTNWHPVGSDGAGNGPWTGNGLAVAIPHEALADGSLPLYAGGNFTSAGGDGQASYIASYDFTRSLTVKLAGSGLGTVQGPGIQCPPVCTARYPAGATVTLQRTVPAGSSFLGFTTGCVSTADCVAVLDADKTVQATWSLPPICTAHSVTAVSGVAAPVQLDCTNPGGRLLYGIYAYSGPHHGTMAPLDVNGFPPASGTMTYTPAAGYVGPDSFVYFSLLDVGSILPAYSNDATVTITVIPPGFSLSAAVVVQKAVSVDATGRLSLSARNDNAFAVQAVSLTVTSATAVASSAKRHKLTLLRSTKVVTLPARKAVKLKGRLSAPGRKLLKRLGRVPVRITIVLQAPNKTRRTIRTKGTLLAPGHSR